jgi:hypothetical protein
MPGKKQFYIQLKDTPRKEENLFPPEQYSEVE